METKCIIAQQIAGVLNTLRGSDHTVAFHADGPVVVQRSRSPLSMACDTYNVGQVEYDVPTGEFSFQEAPAKRVGSTTDKKPKAPSHLDPTPEQTLSRAILTYIRTN